MIWIHCGSDQDAASTVSIVSRLVENCDPQDILITHLSEQTTQFDGVPLAVRIEQIPTDTPVKTRAFVDDLQPRTLIWNGGVLRPVLLRAVARAKIPASLINARTAGIMAGSTRWLPGATKSAVAAFGKILTADGATATRLVRGGVASEKVTACGPILEEPMPLDCNANELSVMTEALGTRPVWLAADIVEGDLHHLTEAHLAACRKNHRLLLILAPRDIDNAGQIAEAMRAAGLKVGLRSDGDDPDPEQQVYIADLEGELGLWYRLSPLTFVGGTIGAGGAASPLDPILLGSAVVHGPRKAPHGARFARLARGEACREIRTASELGVAVGLLISPEHSAKIAVAGWEELSQNAVILNRLIETVLAEGTPA